MKKLLSIIAIVLVMVGGYYLLDMYEKSLPIPDDAVSLEFPLKNGKYYVTQSGKSWRVHSSEVEKYALDIVRHSSFKLSFKFRDTSLESSDTYGTDIYSPCKGVVREIRDGVKDQPIGIRGPNFGGGNTIIIGCDGFDVYMAHVKSGTFKVEEGEIIEIGEKVAQIGNSGNTDGPHLHLMAYRMDNDGMTKKPLPMVFNGRCLYRFDVIDN